jgi:hypothetical protein
VNQVEPVSGRVAVQSPEVSLRPWALREPETSAQKRLVADHLARHTGRELVRFPGYHDDRLDAQVREGRFQGVIFADLDAVLTPIWKGALQLGAWLDAGVEIEIADRPSGGEQLRALLRQVDESYAGFQRRHRQRQIIAGVVLSALVLAAMVALIWVIPGAGK